jgi:uncharacterized protein YfbU (UPF0304 family)
MITSINEFRRSILESSHSDFLRRYNDEIQDALYKLGKMQRAFRWFKSKNGNVDELYNTIELNLDEYDRNVYREIIRWMEQGYALTAHELGNFAIDNLNRFGTEPHMILYAIVDTFEAVSDELGIDELDENFDAVSESGGKYVNHDDPADSVKIKPITQSDIDEIRSFLKQYSKVDWHEPVWDAKQLHLTGTAVTVKDSSKITAHHTLDFTITKNEQGSFNATLQSDTALDEATIEKDYDYEDNTEETRTGLEAEDLGIFVNQVFNEIKYNFNYSDFDEDPIHDGDDDDKYNPEGED